MNVMKKYLFLILAVLISGVIYVAPDYLFGNAIAEAATVRAVADLGAGTSCGGMIQFGQSSSGVKLCKKLVTLEYTSGTMQAAIVDDVKTFSLRISLAEYNALSSAEKSLYTQTIDPGNGDTIYTIQLPSYRPYDSFCSRLGSGWSPYFTPERETANLEGCKHTTTINYTPGQTNQTAITDLYMGFFSQAQYADGAVCGGGGAGWSGWGWHGGVSVGFCKKAGTLPLGVPTELPALYTCNVPEMGREYTITSPNSTYPITYALRGGTYTTAYTPTGGTMTRGSITVPPGGISVSTNLAAGTYNGSGPCSWSFTVANPLSASSCVVPSNSGETFRSPFTVNAVLPAGYYWGNNDPDGDWGPFYFSGNVTQTVGPGWYRGSLNNDSSQCSWNFRVSETSGIVGPGSGSGTTGASSNNCPNGATNPPICTINRNNVCLNGATNAPSCTFTHYILSPWVCAGYDPATGMGGMETRAIVSTTYSSIGPNDPMPLLSRTCNLDPDFNFLSAPSPGESSGTTLSNTYNTFATFIGGQQSAFSVPVHIAVSPRFASRPPNLTFKVVNVSTSLPSGVPNNFTSVPDTSFTPNPLLPTAYSTGTTFVIDVPRVEAGLYTLTVEASGGGLVKQAIVNLYVSVINPTFIEI